MLPRIPALVLAPALALALAALWPALAGGQEAVLTLPDGTDEDLRTVLEAASLTLSLEREGLTEAADFVAAARADYRRLLTGLYAEGYYGGAISITVDGREASGIAPLDAPAAVERVVLSVSPGPRFAFGRTALGPLAPATVLPPGFAPGAVARSETVREAVRAAVAAWRDEGNAKAAVADQALVADQPEARLDVEVAIAPGPELTFGPTTVTGNAAVRTAAILRIAEVREGDAFSPAALELAATRLRRTGAFASVAVVEAEQVGPGDTLPIALQVAESPPRRIGFGAEISSLDGLAANAFWLHRNIGGGAERLRFDAEVADIGSEQIGVNAGGIDYALSVGFARPATFDADNDLTLDARLEREDAADYFLDQFTFDVGLTRYASETLTVNGAVGLLVAREETALEVRDYALLTFPLAAVWDRRDDARDASRGFYIDAELTPFLGVAGDAGSGARLYADARLYRSFGERVTLAARGQAGSVVGPDRADAPQDFLFFSGGGGTVRGQPYQSLGVEVADPDEPGDTLTLGAASFLGAQVEARVGITDSIGAVAFYDAGLTDAGAFPGGDVDAHAGTGLGVRYDTAIGPVRLDVATPASGDDAFGAVQVYIGIGQSF